MCSIGPGHLETTGSSSGFPITEKFEGGLGAVWLQDTA